ncbi:MAG: hypothetical protein ACJ8AK_06315 [Gemmatimonadaceae bacterium]
MQKLLRRIRGAIGMGFAWGAAWSLAGSAPRWLFGFNADVPFPLVFGVLGFIAGIIFFALLVLTERRRTFDQLSLPRFAAWGGVGGLLLSAIFTRIASLGAGDVLVLAPTFVVACAACASGSLALARRAERLKLPDGRGDTADAELTHHEKRRLR